MKLKSRLILGLLITILFYSCATQKDYIPEQVYGLSLKKKLAGSEAKNYVNNLHFNTVTGAENEIGFYEAEKGSAIIYITNYSSESEAVKNIDLMTNKISPQNSTFVASHFEELEGKKVYRTFGMGQSHFVFVHNKSLFWISVETVFGKEFIHEYFKFIK